MSPARCSVVVQRRTAVEALTQTPPAWSRERSESVSLPANLAPEFVDTAQRCLNRDPGPHTPLHCGSNAGQEHASGARRTSLADEMVGR
jgi:hypothetical protein